MKQKQYVTVLILLVCLLTAGCQKPRTSREPFVKEFLAEEQNFPVVVRSLDGAWIPCQSDARVFFLDFPCRNMTVQGFTVEQDRPYWALAVRNSSPIPLEIQTEGRRLSVAPGEGAWIYSAEAAEPGDHSLTFLSGEGGALKGSVELWLADSPEKVTPVYELTARVLKVYEGYLQAEPWHFAGKRYIPDTFYLKWNSESAGGGKLQEDDLVNLSYSGEFTETAPYLLDGIHRMKILGTLPGAVGKK